ncbi:MAG: rRNA methyltransferase [Opitutaceae bacterium]|jgi:23S rRNA (cytidine2498-2'-O)-methyltransferase|nr:rRNA methyltransferase [Opitutaceae bacterium]
MIVCCQPGFEVFAERELRARGVSVVERGAGWLRADAAGAAGAAAVPGELCFAHAVLTGETEVTGGSVNALAAGAAEVFFASAGAERFEGAWPLVTRFAGGLDGLGRRAEGVERAALERVRKRMARVARLAERAPPRGIGRARGLFLFFAGFGRVFVARECVCGGQRRMADDPLAPSRSYLKVEEAYGVLGREPAEGETVADLGAAPGGWSYSAARRGARVVAVDNGPLKGGALGHPLIEHRREDAFRFQPGPGARFDWLFCDLVEEPHHVMRDIVEPWLERGWCRRFVVVLKFGRVDPAGLLREITAPGGVLAARAGGLRARHLYHNREEFTLVGEAR